MSFRRCFRLGAVPLTVLALGCGDGGPDLAAVEGTIRLDGEPLADATVLFSPAATGRPSAGLTDADGRYELVYTSDRDGALLGEHAVSITTYVGADPDSGRGGAPERVPLKYNAKTTLKRTVEAEHNVLDFELDSKGKIVQPID